MFFFFISFFLLYGHIKYNFRDVSQLEVQSKCVSIDRSLDNILSSFPFCCVVISLDVIATTTLETGQPTFCPSDWTATLHWRPYYGNWNTKIFYEIKHIIKSHISKYVQEVREVLYVMELHSLLFCYYVSLISLLTHCSSVPFVLYSSGRHIVLGPSLKAQPDGSLKLRVTQTLIDSFTLFIPHVTLFSIICE